MKFNFRTKTVEGTINASKSKSLNKTLGAFDLIMLGVGCTIGTGIFVLTGTAAANYAGPAIAISYFLSALICIFAGLAYTELSAMMPVAGSAYTYSYVVLGEFIAWIVACGLLLEYTMAASTVAAGWSGYFIGMLKQANINLPSAISKVPSEGGIINLPAFLIAAFIGIILIRGIKESANLNRILVIIKLAVIFIFLYVSAPYIKTENYANFMPFGFSGVLTGAAAIFFAYLGFDSVATAAEETKNPNKNLPIGIIGSLVFCSLLYILVSLALTGIVNYKELANAEPMAHALRLNGSNIGSALVATGAMFGMVAVILVLMYGQSRIFFVMSRDGLLPSLFSKIHPKFNTPHISCLLVTIAVALIAGLTPIRTIGDMASFGTLFAFAVASLIMIILRKKMPNFPRPFKCPSYLIIGILAFLGCSYLMIKLVANSPKIFAIWFFLSVLIYFSYIYYRSPFNKKP